MINTHSSRKCPKPSSGMEIHDGHLPSWKEPRNLAVVWCPNCGTTLKKVYDREGIYF